MDQASFREKRAKEQAKHQEEMGKTGALKEGYETECAEAYNEGMTAVGAVKTLLAKVWCWWCG